MMRGSTPPARFMTLRDYIIYIIDKRELKQWIIDAIMGIGDPGRAIKGCIPDDVSFTKEEIEKEIDSMIADKTIGVEKAENDEDYWLCN